MLPEKKKFFEQKRKKHYNEFYAVKLARKLMENDDEEDEEDNKNGDKEEGEKDMEEEMEQDAPCEEMVDAEQTTSGA